ncbi:MAG TPA: hypothetical protein VMW69_07940, partial [Spirochaetia bacterium]|nr:hypothetical protein [Spirochaetia bacterium]
DIIASFDLVALQEIRDSRAGAPSFSVLLEEISKRRLGMTAITSESLGRTSYKERYAFVYDRTRLALVGRPHTYDDDRDGDGMNRADDSRGGDEFEREPFAAYFRVRGGNFDFAVIDVHVRPDDAANEIPRLGGVIDSVRGWFGEPDIVLLGDLNADGKYYPEEELQSVFPGDAYQSIIPNGYDTTVASSDATYDRIIVTRASLEDFTGRFGVLRFEADPLSASRVGGPAELSDHYPVWAEFYVNHDSE